MSQSVFYHFVLNKAFQKADLHHGEVFFLIPIHLRTYTHFMELDLW